MTLTENEQRNRFFRPGKTALPVFRISLCGILAFAAAGILSSPAALAEDVLWTGMWHDDWFEEMNWSWSEAPGADDYGVINNGDTVRLDSWKTGTLYWKGTSLGVASGESGHLHVFNSQRRGTAAVFTEDVNVGVSGDGILTVDSTACLDVGNNLYIAKDGSGFGDVTVTDEGRISVGSALYVGRRGIGTLIVDSQNAAEHDVYCHHASVGRDSGSLGNVTLSGADTDWRCDDALSVGYAGDGFVTIENGARLSVGDTLYVGHEQNGTLIVNGQNAAEHDLYSQYAYVGYDSGSLGDVTLSGADTDWRCESKLAVGYLGEGTVVVEDSAHLSVGAQIEVGDQSNSCGSLTIRNGGSVASSEMAGSAGHSQIGGYLSHGTLTMENGSYRSEGDLFVAGGSEAILTDGSTLEVVDGPHTDGTFFIGSRGLEARLGTVTNDASTVSTSSSFGVNHGTYDQVSGTTSVGADLKLGTGNIPMLGSPDTGIGEITHSGGEISVAGNTYLGYQWPAAATYQLSGDAALTTTDLCIGYKDRGDFIQSGGTTLCNGRLLLGNDTGKEGTLDLSGGTMTTGEMRVGELGDGTVEQTGGTLTANGSLRIGEDPAATGTYNLSGDGTAVFNSWAVVGYDGEGTLNQTGGTLSVAGTNQMYIAERSGSTGTYDLSGGTASVAADLVVGGGGTGLLHVGETGRLTVGGRLDVQSGGTVNLDGGMLQVAEIRHTAGGAFNFTGGTLSVETFGGDLTVAGTGILSPGASPGLTTVEGDLSLDGGSILIELDGLDRGDSYDAVDVTGTLTAGGTLDVVLIDDFDPGLGDTFDLFDGTISGTFETMNYPTLTENLKWCDANLYTTGVLSVIDALGIPGDLNGDGAVSSRDLDIVRGGWGNEVEPGRKDLGDATGDGLVNSADLDLVRSNWGTGLAAVPEPGGVLLMVLGVALSAWRRYR